MALTQWDWRSARALLRDTNDRPEVGRSTLSGRLVMIWLVGTLILLPLDFVHLPLNMAPVDVWILLGLPVLLLTFVRNAHVMSLSYAIAMWLILFASLLSTFAAPAPTNSLIVLGKEVYIYVWFVTLAAVLVTLKTGDFRRLLIVWTAVAFFHGFLIVAQFASPAFWQVTSGIVSRSSDYAVYRPSGFFENANAAAVFQLFGFVPLVLVAPSKRVGMVLGMLLLLTMLATGSMGATIAFTAGVVVAIAAIFLSGRLGLIIKMMAQLAVVLLLLGGMLAFVVSHNQRYHDHFERILFGRAERSSEGRFELWQGGIEVFLDHSAIVWGVGPENHRVLGEKGKQLHNDFIAFLVERGLIGVLGLTLFAATAVGRAAFMIVLYNKYPSRAQLTVVVFLAAMVAMAIESLTHQTFRLRILWLVLAFQEAVLIRMMTAVDDTASPAPLSE